LLDVEVDMLASFDDSRPWEETGSRLRTDAGYD
jgi:hypothetical protein